MNEPGRASNPPGLVDAFFRQQYGRLVARLCKKYGAEHLENIEDAVQKALERALFTWAKRGVPEAPDGWLSRTAENSLIDHLRRARRLVWDHEGPPDLLQHAEQDESVLACEVADAELRMLFVCCDAALPLRTRLILCLKLLCGFSVREIAARLFVSEASVQKTFVRGRARLKELMAGEPLLERGADRLGERLGSVQQAIYLQFTEGHSSIQEQSPVRQDVCWAALRLAEILVRSPVGDTPSSWALLALLHFQYARLGARTNAQGEIVLLEDQDRSLWDRGHIQAGMNCLVRSGQGDEFGRFHGEAAILAEHCLAPSYAATRWHEIVELYELLEHLLPSPLYTLNRAIALCEWKGPVAALSLLNEQKPPAWLAGYYLWQGTIGEMHRRAGETSLARAYLERAIEAAPNGAQRLLFERRLQSMEHQNTERQGRED